VTYQTTNQEREKAMCDCHAVNNYRKGDFLSELLYTDTLIWEVVATTAKTITIRGTRRTAKEKRSDNGSPYPIVYREVVSDPNRLTKVLKLRKDGTFRTGRGMNALRLAPKMDFGSGIESPYDKTDYSY
jgi:hypothetical protein